MELTPVPPDQGGDDDVSGLQPGLRLSDAGEIAAQRLEGAAEGSLKEALAIAHAEDADKVSPQLADPISAAGTSFAAGPLVRRIEARFAEIDRTQVHEPTVAFSPMPRPPVLDVAIALVAPPDPAPALAIPEIAGIIEPASPPPEDRPDPIDDALATRAAELPPAHEPAPTLSPDAPTPSLVRPEIAGIIEPAAPPPEDRPDLRSHPIDDALATPVAELPPESEASRTLSTDAPTPPSIQPLTSALDAAARLAADANVAAEALENLKRLLEHKQQLESRLPQLAAGSAISPASDNAHALASAFGSEAPVPPPLPPLPLPLHAEPDDADESGRALLPPPSQRRLPPERRGLDVRGFLAGFALSWAFGVVLYLFMTSG